MKEEPTREKSKRSDRAEGRQPSLVRRAGRFLVEHPKGVLIAGATLLGLIVVFQNWHTTSAFLLVAKVPLPFMVWAMIFMLVGYLTGKWIEWAIQRRRIRRGTYKARVSPEELADASASLEGRLQRGDDAPPTGEPEGAPGMVRSGSAGAARSGPAGGSDEPRRGGPAPEGEYWNEPSGRSPGPSRPARGGRYSPSARQAAQEGRRRRARRPAERREAQEGYEDHGEAGRYGDYQDAGRYGDYQDGGRYGDYVDAGRYGDYQDGGRYEDYVDAGRYEDYQDAAEPGEDTGEKSRGRGGGGA